MEDHQLDKILELQTDFNTNLYNIIYLYIRHAPFSDSISLVRNNMGNITKILLTNPDEKVIETVGPHIYEYRTEIKLRDWDSLFEIDIKSKIESNEMGFDVIALMRSVKNLILKSKEKNTSLAKSIETILDDMLSIYCEYSEHIKSF